MSLIRKFLSRTSRASGSARPPRVRLISLHNIGFRPLVPKFSEELKLISSSTSGVGFLRNSSTVWPPKNSIIEGELVIEGSWYPVKLRVAYLSEVVVGCAYVSPAPELTQLLRRHFEAEFSAMKLQEVDPKLLRQSHEGDVRALIGDNCEIRFISGPNGIRRFHMSFLGNYIEGGEGRPTRFGSLVDSFESPLAREADMVEWEEFPTDDLIDMCVRFVENISSLGMAERKAIRSYLLKP